MGVDVEGRFTVIRHTKRATTRLRGKTPSPTLHSWPSDLIGSSAPDQSFRAWTRHCVGASACGSRYGVVKFGLGDPLQPPTELASECSVTPNSAGFNPTREESVELRVAAEQIERGESYAQIR